MLLSIEHVQIPDRQMDRAISWYTGHLGFRLDGRDGNRIAFLSLQEGPMLMLWETPDETYAHFTVNGTEFPVLLYRTDKIHELHDRLLSLGVTIQTYNNEGFGWVLKFYDPEGNLWGVLQMNGKQEPEQPHV